MKRENGITLISLVITAMVMAILAGITISATIGDDGLLTTAQNQKEKIKNRYQKNDINLIGRMKIR